MRDKRGSGHRNYGTPFTSRKRREAPNTGHVAYGKRGYPALLHGAVSKHPTFVSWRWAPSLPRTDPFANCPLLSQASRNAAFNCAPRPPGWPRLSPLRDEVDRNGNRLQRAVSKPAHRVLAIPQAAEQVSHRRRGHDSRGHDQRHVRRSAAALQGRNPQAAASHVSRDLRTPFPLSSCLN